ncbi:MAG: hypothetical protein J2P54_07710 [Bradyrhizobiaceae bacterium]|nr:hypothetical protein [Bradyrhizobiaceae bacterium]
MRTRTIALATLASTTLLVITMARADTEAAMNDCSEIHEIIDDLSPAELVPMCRAAMRTMGIFGGPKFTDFRYLVDYTEAMSKVAGYKRGQYDQIISEVAQIIKLRGQSQKPERWPYTADIVFRTYSTSNAAITPTDFIGVLSGAGPLAETVSDDGLIRLMLVGKHERDNNEERK